MAFASEPELPPPADIEAEQALLGTLLVFPAVYDQVAPFLRAAHFSNPVHQRLYGAIAELISEGARPDPVTVKNRLGDIPDLVLLGGASAFVTRLMLAAGPSVNAEHYGHAIAALAVRRDLMDLGHDLRAAAADPVIPIAETAARARVELTARLAEGHGLGEWDAAADLGPLPPRGWLMGSVFCRRFVSSLLADGGIGKTALRIAQLLAVATGRPLTGEYVYQRCRVLLVSLEDDRDELRRRVRAAMLYHGVSDEEVRGWLFLCTPGRSAGKLATSKSDAHEVGPLLGELCAVVERRKIDIVCIDPFVKSHGVEENSNGAVDFVIGLLTQMAIDHDCAVDAPHHVSKGDSDPGNSNRGRGASAFKDGGRLVYTLSAMNEEEAEEFGVTPDERRRLIRMDSGKVNIARQAAKAVWFRLVSVPLGNGTALYPHGDEVQTVEPWEPVDLWQGVPIVVANKVLDRIEAGLADGRRYSPVPQSRDRAAWVAVREIVTSLTDRQAKAVIAVWVKNHVVETRLYRDPVTRKESPGLWVNQTKRPG